MKNLLIILAAVFMFSCTEDEALTELNVETEEEVVEVVPTELPYTINQDLYYRFSQSYYDGTEPITYVVFSLKQEGALQYTLPEYEAAGAVLTDENSPEVDQVRINFDGVEEDVLFDWNIAAEYEDANNFLHLEVSLDSTEWETVWTEVVQQGCEDGCVFEYVDNLNWLLGDDNG